MSGIRKIKEGTILNFYIPTRSRTNTKQVPLNPVSMVTWKGLNTETPQRGNVSKKRTHKTNLMSSSLIKKITIILPLI